MRLPPVTQGAVISIEFAPSRHPAFDIDHVRVFGPKISGTTLQQAVRKCQSLQDGLDSGNHVGVMRSFFFSISLADDHLLDLVELMNTVEPGGVTSSRASFSAEAGRSCGDLDR